METHACDDSTAARTGESWTVWELFQLGPEKRDLALLVPVATNAATSSGACNGDGDSESSGRLDQGKVLAQHTRRLSAWGLGAVAVPYIHEASIHVLRNSLFLKNLPDTSKTNFLQLSTREGCEDDCYSKKKISAAFVAPHGAGRRVRF